MKRNFNALKVHEILPKIEDNAQLKKYNASGPVTRTTHKLLNSKNGFPNLS